MIDPTERGCDSRESVPVTSLTLSLSGVAWRMGMAFSSSTAQGSWVSCLISTFLSLLASAGHSLGPEGRDKGRWEDPLEPTFIKEHRLRLSRPTPHRQGPPPLSVLMCGDGKQPLHPLISGFFRP